MEKITLQDGTKVYVDTPSTTNQAMVVVYIGLAAIGFILL